MDDPLLRMKTKKIKRKVKQSFKEKGVVCSDEEMLDLSKDLYPLSHHVDDEDELVAQLFATIKQKKLQSMLPPVLKEVNLTELQNLCLHELRGMSRRRILSAINGQHMSSSSSDEFDNEGQKSKAAKVNGAVPPAPPLPKLLPNFIPVKSEENHLVPKESSWSKEDADDERLIPDKSRTPPPPPIAGPPSRALDDVDPSNLGNLTALDLLELEMRAKLIKTMLDKQPSDDEEGKTGGPDPLTLIPPEEIKLEPPSPEALPSKLKRRYSSRSRSRSFDDSRGSRSRSRSLSHRASRSRSVSRSRSRKSSRSSRSSRSSPSESLSSQSDAFNRGNSDFLKSPTDAEKSSKKKKITRKEFHERMQKARLNRRYRKRRDSDSSSDSDSDTDTDSDDAGGSKSRRKKRKKRERRHRKASWEIEYFEKLKLDLKGKEGPKKEAPKEEAAQPPRGGGGGNDDVEEGEYESKEEGEIDSGEEKPLEVEPEEEEEAEEEEEEGACSPSDKEGTPAPPPVPITCLPNPKATGKSSHSESGSRSPRRRSRRRKKKKKKASVRLSRSKTPPLLRKIRQTKKRPQKKQQQQSSVFTAQEFRRTITAKESLAELIDSDENFDDATKSEATLPSKSERQNISFSFTKKNVAAKRTGKETEAGVAASTAIEDVAEPLSDLAEEAVIPRGGIKTSRRGFSPHLSPTRAEFDASPEIRHVTPLIELLNPPQTKTKTTDGGEDLNLLFTDWEDLPAGESLPTSDPSNDTLLPSSDKDADTGDKLTPQEDPADESLSMDANDTGELQKNLSSFTFTSVKDSKSTIDSEDQSGDRSDAAEEDEEGPEPPSAKNLCPSKIDIIGVIEPRNDSNSDSFDEELLGGSTSWSSRWLQSEKVQNVVSNSKILSKMRKTIKKKGKGGGVPKKSARRDPQNQPPPPPASAAETPSSVAHTPAAVVVHIPEPPVAKPVRTSSSVIGSIEEYEKLIGLRVSGGLGGPGSTAPASKLSMVTGLDSDDDEDSEEEALWSKIMKK